MWKNLPIALNWHRSEAPRAHLRYFCRLLSNSKHIERVSREARSLFNSAVAVNRPEHLQTVLLKLNRIGSEVDHATETIQAKIASVTDNYRQTDFAAVNDTLLHFPWPAKRNLFLLMSAWNGKLSTVGQVISMMKKLASIMGSNSASVVGGPLQEELFGGMNHLKELNGQYSHYSVTDTTQDIAQGLPRLRDGERLTTMILMTQMYRWGVDADTLASRRWLRHSKPSNQKSRSKSGHLKHSSDSQGLRVGVIFEPSPKANCWWRGKVGYFVSIQSRSVGRRCVCGCYLGILEKDDLSPRQGERKTHNAIYEANGARRQIPSIRTLCDVFGMQARLRVLTRWSHVRKMAVGSEAPTIIQPPLYKARSTNAMERYFTTAPSKWTSI